MIKDMFYIFYILETKWIKLWINLHVTDRVDVSEIQQMTNHHLSLPSYDHPNNYKKYNTKYYQAINYAEEY